MASCVLVNLRHVLRYIARHIVETGFEIVGQANVAVLGHHVMVVEPPGEFFEALIDFLDERGISSGWLRHGFKLIDDLQHPVFQIAEVGNADRGRRILQVARHCRELFRQDVKIERRCCVLFGQMINTLRRVRPCA